MMARTSKRMAIRIATLLPSLIGAACSVGPKFLQPDVSAPSQFRYEIAAPEATSFADLPWWSVFDDKTLQALITEALANNQNLKVTVARIEEARARVGEAESQGLPQIGYEASAAGEKAVIQGPNGNGKAFTFGSFTGLLNAAWELDIWGRIRHATDSAKARLLEQEDVRRGVILTLVSDVAADYFSLLELDNELAIAEQSAKDYKHTFDLFDARFQGGKDSKLPVERAQAAYQTSLADIQDLKRRIALEEDAIAVLLGAYPKPVERSRTLDAQVAPQTPLGATTALLKRRPDIMAQEHEMIAANEDIGEAVANFFPRIGLSAFIGGQGLSIASTFSGFGVWNVAAALAGPIYSGGRLESEYHGSQAYWDEAVATYRQKVLVAFQETSDALVAQRTLAERRIALENQVKSLQQSVTFAFQRYEAGRSTYFEVLEAQQQLFPGEDALAQTRRDQLLAVVNLYKALGGGWHGTAGDETAPAGTAASAGGTATVGG